MGLNLFDANFRNIGNQGSLRPSFGYRHFFDIQKAEIFPCDDQIRLSKVLKFLPSSKIKKGELEESEVLIDLCNIERRFNSLLDLEEVNEIGSDKSILQDGDIVIPKIQPQMGNFFLNLEHKRFVGSTELLEYSISPDFDPLFLYYLLTSCEVLTQLEKLESGKTHRRVNSDDFLKLKIPNIAKTKQENIVSSIHPIELDIKRLKANIKDPSEIINLVFTSVFGFDLSRFEELKHITQYNLDFSSFGNNRDLRQSVRFHNIAGKFVLDELLKITKKKIKDYIQTPICLGVSVSPCDYDECGIFHYISMANIKHWKFESEDSKLVSKEYSDRNQNKTVAKGDILLARSGEGTIGKVALIDDEDLDGIFADFTMRIRLNNYNPIFAYFYFRTNFFQYLVEINKKGLGNNTNIFPGQIQEFPLIDIPLDKQQRIVDEINRELEKQEQKKIAVLSKRARIDEIIIDSLRMQ